MCWFGRLKVHVHVHVYEGGVYFRCPHSKGNLIRGFHMLYIYICACTCICALHMYAVTCVDVTINNESMSIK